MSNLTYPVSPLVFMNRVAVVSVLLFMVQFFHLFFLTNAGTEVLVVFSVFYLFFFLSLASFLSYVKRKRDLKFFHLNYKVLFILIILGFIGKFFARIDYVVGGYGLTLWEVRNDPAFSVSGWWTYLSVFFYPACMLMAFVTSSKRVFRVSVVLLASVLIVAMVYTGQRGPVLLVGLVYLLAFRGNYNNKTVIIVCSVLVIVLVSAFSYTTMSRTGEYVYGGFTWLNQLHHTISTQVISFKDVVLSFVNTNAPFLFPFIFLTHYLSHSFGELTFLINSLDRIEFSGPNYLLQQLCQVGLCDKEFFFNQIMQQNLRGAVYTTVLGPFIYDFGFIGALLVLFFLWAMTFVNTMQRKSFGPFAIVFWVCMSLGSIANYFYSALGLIEWILFILIPILMNVVNQLFLRKSYIRHE